MKTGLLIALVAAVSACSSRGTSTDESNHAPSPPAAERAGDGGVPDMGTAALGRDAGAAPRHVVLPPAPPVPEPPIGLPESPAPPNRTGMDDERLPAKVALGRLLFFDARLSQTGEMSCASCHDPDMGWSNGVQRARTAAGKLDLRHNPSLVNIAYAGAFSWDGRFEDLEAMLSSHWRGQMLDDRSDERVLDALLALPRYRAHFRRAFSGPVRPASVSAALAAFVRTIYSGASPWDRHEAGEPDAVAEDAIAGFEIFSRKAQCVLCHPPPLYTDGGYHDAGIGALGPDGELLDPGRALVTGRADDRGKFKTPTLRHVAATAPYYHDGSVARLADTVEHGLRSAAMRAGPAGGVPASLTEDDMRQLLAFLEALTPKAQPYERPILPGKNPGVAPSVPGKDGSERPEKDGAGGTER